MIRTAGICVNCGGTEFVPNPTHTHWRHCPTCEPTWVESIRTNERLRVLDAMRVETLAAVQTQRGRPSRNGQRY